MFHLLAGIKDKAPMPIGKKHVTPQTGLLLLLPVLVLCLICAHSFASPRHAPSPLFVDHNLGGQSFTQHLSYLVDPTGHAEIGDVASRAGQFEPVPDRRGDPSFGYSRASYWFMFTVKNNQTDAVEWILEFSYPLIDSLALYIPDDGEYRVIETGDRLPFDQRMMPYRAFAFPLMEPPGERTYFIRVASRGALTVPLKAWSPPAFQQKISKETLLFGFSYGILLAMAIYHIFIFVSIREKSYLYLTFLIIFAGLFSMINIGIAYQYLWPATPDWGNMAHPFFLAAGNLAALQFVRVFLNTKTLFPRWDRLLISTMAIAALLIPLSLVLEYYHITRATTMLTLFTGILAILSGIASLARGYREARYYLLACLAFFIGAMLTAFRAYGMLPENFLTSWSNQIGMVAMALLFSFGVADKINVIRREREKAVGDLADSEEKYRTLVENAHDGIVMMAGKRPVLANTPLMEMLGYKKTELASLTIDDILPDTPLGKPLVGDYYRRRLRGEDVPTKYEGQLRKKDGTIIDCSFSASRITVGGRPGVIAIISDITSLKQAKQTIVEQYNEIQSQYERLAALNRELTHAQEAQIRLNERLGEEKEQLAAILKSISDAVIATDIQGRVILMNVAAEHLTGRKQEEALDLEVKELLGLPPDTFPANAGDITSIAGYSGKPFVTGSPLRLKRGDGSECDVEIAGAPLRPGGGKQGMVFAVRDITAKIKLEKEIQKAGKIESIGLLAGGIAHDFNNLLTAIIGNLSLLRTMVDKNDPKTAPVVDRIEQASVQAVNLTRQLLTFSRGGEPVKKHASIRDLLYENIDFLLSGSAVTPRFDIEEGLWPVEVDSNQIVQVIHNLVINAIQAMPGGGEIVISAVNLDAVQWLPLSEGRYVRITFTDQGTGIPRHNLVRVFDPYFSTKEQGNGLGLSICYSIVKKHGGHIDVESVENKGTSFHIYLPASEGEIAREKKTARISKERRGRILVMDDEEAVREVAEGLLTHLGFDVVCVSEGTDAVEQYRRAKKAGAPFSAVIMDLTVSGGTGGKEAIHGLLAYDPDAVALVSSGYSKDMVMANYREYGFSGVLSKPYTLEDLARVLDEALNPEEPSPDNFL
ncbi:MAG: 7TM diverse intracellular signaling domain-containing protein [Desulfosalsimonadaceae bacterium]